MTITEKIIQAMEEAARESHRGKTQPRTGLARSRTKLYPGKRRVIKKSVTTEFELVGYAVAWPPIKWDDLGLGLIRNMGFIHNRPVKLSFNKGEWSLSGPAANSTVLWFLAAGGGGLVYFLKDLLAQINNWGPILQGLIPVLIPLLSLFFRKRTLKFKPYEIEMLAYDTESHILILSTLTQPGGVVALRPELPQDEKRMKDEELRMMQNLRKLHKGFFKIDGLAKPDMSVIKSWSLWTLVWLIIAYLYYHYFT